jgi:hypothetical protein
MMRWNPDGVDAKPKMPHFAAGETAALDVAIVEEMSEELRVGVMLDKDALDTTELDATELDVELDKASAQSRSKHGMPRESSRTSCSNVYAGVDGALLLR